MVLYALVMYIYLDLFHGLGFADLRISRLMGSIALFFYGFLCTYLYIYVKQISYVRNVEFAISRIFAYRVRF